MKPTSRILLLLALCIPLLFPIHPSPVAAQSTPWIQIPSPFLPGGPVDALAAADSDPDVLYALVQSSPGDALYRSADGGDSWEIRYQFTSQVRSARQFQIGIDPHNPDLLYVGMENILMRSVDGGFNWEPFTPFGEAFAVVTSDLLYATGKDPSGSGTCGDPPLNAYAFQRSLNGGLSWEQLSTVCEGMVNLLVVSASNPDVIYLTGFGFEFDNLRSEDGGKTWSAFKSVDSTDITSLVVDPANPAILYASGSAGFACSLDSGQTWQHSSNDIGTFHHLAYSGSSVYAIQSVPQPSSVYRSDDHGASWLQSLTSLPSGTLSFIADRSGRLYAGLYGNGVYRSDNGGSAWSEKNAGIQTQATVKRMAVAPASAGTLYVLTGQPYLALIRTRDFGTTWEKPYRGGLIPSISAEGASGPGFVRAGLSTAAVGLEPFSIEHILVNPANADIAWAGGYSGLFETTNGGQEWLAVAPSLSIMDLAVSGAAPDQPYALGREPGGWIQVFQKHCADLSNCWYPNSALYLSEAMILASDPRDSRHLFTFMSGYNVSDFHESRDSAATWQFVSRPDIPGRIEALTVSPADPRTLLVSTTPHGLNAADPPIYCSQDGGITWLNWSQGILRTNLGYSPLALDGLGNAYYGSDDGVFVRAPGGPLWQPFDLEERIVDLALYSNQQQVLYAATSHGIWLRSLAPISRVWLPMIVGG